MRETSLVLPTTAFSSLYKFQPTLDPAWHQYLLNIYLFIYLLSSAPAVDPRNPRESH